TIAFDRHGRRQAARTNDCMDQPAKRHAPSKRAKTGLRIHGCGLVARPRRGLRTVIVRVHAGVFRKSAHVKLRCWYGSRGCRRSASEIAWPGPRAPDAVDTEPQELQKGNACRK